jgi:dihydrofolate reductase
MENKKPTIALIVAHDLNLAIGWQGDMPWRLSADLKRFKTITMGHPVIMGRKTFQSLPNGALPGRKNIVVTNNPKFTDENITVAHSPDEAIQLCHENEIVFIIGGGNLYNTFIDQADMLYITLIEHEFKADTWFPTYDLKNYTLLEEVMIADDSRFPYPYHFKTYIKNC